LIFEPWQEFADGELAEFGEVFTVDLEAEGFRLEALAATRIAGGVGAVAGKEDADMHLVGFGFQPVEETLHAVPAAGLPEFLQLLRRACPTVSVVNPFAGFLI